MKVPIAAALLLVAAGCSADGRAAAPTTSSRETASTTGPSTTSTSTTTTSSTTTSSTTTSSTTTSTATTTAVEAVTTSVVPASAVPPSGGLDAELQAAYQRVFDGYWACLRGPSSCEMSWLADGSPAKVAMQGNIRALIDRDRFVGPDDVGTFVIEDVSLDPAGGRAEVTTCWTTLGVLYGAPADPTAPVGASNPPTVVNDTQDSVRQRDVMVRDGLTWDVFDSDVLEYREEVGLCSDG